MDLKEITNMYNFTNKTVVITGGAGVLGAEMACALVGCGANVAIIDRDISLAEEIAKKIDTMVGKYIIVYGDVLNRKKMESAAKHIIKTFGDVYCLINAAGGNHPMATTSPDLSFFDLDPKSIEKVSNLNLLGTIIPSQVFGKYFSEKKEGVILNVSSMSAFRPLTRVAAYSAAKAAISNFTQWLAVHMAQEYSPNIRVNAIAPGFFLTAQNRFLLTDEKTGNLTKRGQQIIDHTPMGRFGNSEDLLGTVLWLISPASAFVTGIVSPVDGGFSAYSGV
jgi:NAD(P)-dependent dehydrogenase (short-subunit alcohol dehydrogenase family)